MAIVWMATTCYINSIQEQILGNEEIFQYAYDMDLLGNILIYRTYSTQWTHYRLKRLQNWFEDRNVTLSTGNQG